MSYAAVASCAISIGFLQPIAVVLTLRTGLMGGQVFRALLGVGSVIALTTCGSFVTLSY